MAASSTPSTVIFIDSNVPDYQSLIDNRNADTEVIVLDANRDGIAQITEYLAGQQDISTIHIVSHGSNGALQLGSTTLTTENLGTYTEQIQSWSSALTENADILLYGCNVATTDTGTTFVQEMARLTGADLAASTNLTGDSDLGGDWVLEYATGAIESNLAFQTEGLAQFDAVLAAFGEGNLVVLRVGDEVNRNQLMAPIYLDEYTINGDLVQTIAVPVVDDSNGNQGLTLPDHRFNLGSLNLSADGHFLTFGGWDLALNSFAGPNPGWVIGVVDGSGNVDTTTVIPNAPANPNGDLSSVASTNGIDLWLGSDNSNGSGSVRYTTYTDPTVIQQITPNSFTLAQGSVRALDIFGGQLYATSDQVEFRPIQSIGTGLPTTAASPQILPGFDTINSPNLRNPSEFVLLDLSADIAGLDTLYVTTLTGINKFSFDGTAWAARGTFSSQGNSNWLGLTAASRIDGNGNSSIDLFAVRASGLGNQVIRITDTAAFNANIASTGLQILATAPANGSFRGLAFTPSLSSVRVQVEDNEAREADQAPTNIARFLVSRDSIAGTMAVSLTLSGLAGSADYSLNTGTVLNNILTVTIPAGQSSVEVILTAQLDTQVEGNENLIFTLNPAAGYQIVTGAASGTITILDNRPPVATADILTLDEDSSRVIIPAELFSNDQDPDGNTTLTDIEVVTGVNHGVLRQELDGSLTYIPNADFSGMDSFTYQAIDHAGLRSNTVTVQLQVNPLPDTPVAVEDIYILDEDTTLTIPARGILANDRDADGQNTIVAAQLVSGVDHGVLNLNTDGSFTYTPDGDFDGIDRFIYQVEDVTGRLSDPVTVELRIGDISETPVGVGDRYTLIQNSLLQIQANSGVLRNDTDAEKDPLTAILVSGPTHGSLTLNSNGSFAYRPNTGFQGLDQFIYRANDGTTSSAPTTVTLEVTRTNQAPQVAQPLRTQIAREDQRFAFQLPSNAFIDGDGDRLTYRARRADGTALPGWLRFNANTQRFVGTPRNADVGNVRIQVLATDSQGNQTISPFWLRVRNTNDTPRVGRTPSNFSALVNRQFSIRLPGNAFVDDDLGDRLRYQARLTDGRALPAWLRFDPSNLSFQGRPPAQAEGTYQIQLLTRDRQGASAFTTFTLRVRSNANNNNNTGDMPNPSHGILGTDFRDSDNVRGTAEGDRIQGLGQNDYIRGFGGHDLLLGDDGNDVLDGGEGNDWLIGGTGSDTLFGNTGRDVFVLRPGSGTDLIADFQDGVDRIALAGGISFTNLQITQGSAGAELRFHNEVLAQLHGIQVNQITATDVLSISNL